MHLKNMVAVVDIRKVAGSAVQTLAVHVISKQECRRCYGAQWGRKKLDGIVESLAYEVNPATNKRQGIVTATFQYGTDNRRSVRLGLKSVLVPSQLAVDDDEMNQPVAVAVVPNPVAALPQVVAPHIPNPAVIPRAGAMIPNVARPRLVVPYVDELIPENCLDMEMYRNESSGSSTDSMDSMDSMDSAGIAMNIHDVDNDLMNNNHEEEMPVVVPQQLFHNELQPPLCTRHGMQWFENDGIVRQNINGDVPDTPWEIQTTLRGECIGKVGNIRKNILRLEMFLLMFPPTQLKLIVSETSSQCQLHRCAPTTKDEVIKLFGIFILITKYEFSNRKDLWRVTPKSKYEVAPNFGGLTDMRRKRFEDLWRHIRFGISLPSGQST
jgi:Transposase IS4